MADLLSDAHHHAQAARAADETHLDEHVLTDLRRRYLGAYTAGIRDNHNRCGPLAKDAAALARRFRDQQDMILRFVVDLAVLHQQPGRARPPPGQNPATHQRRHLAHPGRPGRLRRRPVLSVHRRRCRSFGGVYGAGQFAVAA